MSGRDPGFRRSRAASLVVVALTALAVGLLATADAQGARKRDKPRQVTCTAGQVTVTVGRRQRCAAAPTAAGDPGTPQAALLRALVTRNFGVVKIRGKRVRSIWKANRRLKRVRRRLLRALPKVLAAVQNPLARASTRVPGDAGSCSGLPPGENSASFDGFQMSIGNNGDVNMSVSASNGYVIQVFLGGTLPCSDLDLPECPTAAGQLNGTDGRGTVVGLRITQNGDLVQSLRTTVRSQQTLAGEVADDAKLDHMSLKDVANERTVFQVPQGSVRMTLSVLRTVKLNMRNGAFIESPRVRVGFSFGGQTQEQASAAASQAARAYEASFSDLIREERANFQRREQLWQGAGRCAKIVFSPGTESFKVAPGDTGTVTPTVESNAGGTAAKARWTVSAPEHGTFTPDAAEGPSPGISYTVRGTDHQKVKASFRVTSTAGVAEGTWAQEIVEGVRYYRVTAFDHTDRMRVDGLPAVAGCTPSTTQNNHTTLKPSGLPYDGAIGPIDATGPHEGSLTLTGDVGKYAEFSGCKLNDDATAWVSCTQTGADTTLIATVVGVELPATGPAIVTWQPFPTTLGDVPPVISPCVVFGGTPSTAPDPVITTVPREVFTSPGEQTLSVDVPKDVPNQGGGTIHSTAHYALTILRVKEDGSPYAG